MITDKVCEALSRILAEGVDVHRCAAAQALGRIGHPGAVATLTEALLDEDEDVRTDASAALAVLADPRAAGPIKENLVGDPCPEVKLNAIDLLVKTRDPEIAGLLAKLVVSRAEDEVYWDEDNFHGGWDDWIDVQVKALEGLAELSVETAVPAIEAAIADEFGQDITDQAFAAFARLGQPGFEALARHLEDDNSRVRRRAAAVLCASGDQGVHDAVSRALGDESADVRLAAAQALAGRDPGDARLAALLADEDVEVRAACARLFGRYHPEGLSSLLQDIEPGVKQAAFEVLAANPKVTPPDGVDACLRSLLHGSGVPAAAAASALAAVVGRPAAETLANVAADAERPEEARIGAVRGLGRVGGEIALNALAELVGDDARQVRIEAMAALSRLAEAEGCWPSTAGDTLLAALRGELVPEPGQPEETQTPPEIPPEPETGVEREDAAEAEKPAPTSTLEAIMGAGAASVEAVTEGEEAVELDDHDLELLDLSSRTPRKSRVSLDARVAPHMDVRRFAARVLGDLAFAEVAEALAERLDDGDEEVARTAADSLARIGAELEAFPEEVDARLADAAGGADRDVRLGAIRALGVAGGAVAALWGATGDPDTFVRIESIRALGRHGMLPDNVGALLEDTDIGVRLAAAEAVASVGGEDAVDTLIRFAYADEGTHRRQAAELMERVDAAEATEKLLALLEDEGAARGWRVAIEILGELNRVELRGLERPAA